MTRGIRVRLMLFVILSAVGIVYVTANYLGVVDKVLGRGFTVHATLPDSGGLYEGSSVTYRGVKIGKVAKMSPTEDGLKVDLALKEGTKLPIESSIHVHNLSAVGEQYLDFEPVTNQPPYAKQGTTYTGNASSLPVGEDDLLVQLDEFVSSVDKESTSVVLKELGDMFSDADAPLSKLIENGVHFVDVAVEHTPQTIKLLRQGHTVLKSQQGQSENIRAFSRDLKLLTKALRQSDQDLRTVLKDAPPAVREVHKLLKDLEPTLPVLLGNMVTANGVMVAHLSGIEQILVEFPRAVAAGFTGTPGDGWGHTNLQLAQTPLPCTGKGYKPAKEWRSPHDLT
ncbi:MlaD family protein, partial [Nocardioides alcanivorans]|uniref:MlaD family protein n=1 Tax=Nocardioides alcanivorans TaxID=2897352 RepID=UPI001F316CF5